MIAPPLIDPLVVLRSARALDRYGPDFRYAHYIVVKRLPTLAVLPYDQRLARLGEALADAPARAPAPGGRSEP